MISIVFTDKLLQGAREKHAQEFGIDLPGAPQGAQVALLQAMYAGLLHTCPGGIDALAVRPGFGIPYVMCM